MKNIVPIVEGYGEVEAMGILIRKILIHKGFPEVSVDKPFNAKGVGNLLQEETLRKFVRSALKRPNCGGILLLRDSECDCPKNIVQDLYKKIKDLLYPDISLEVVIAKCEYEAWFLASLSTIRGERIKGREGLPPSLSLPFNKVEEIRDVKGWISEHLPFGRRYKETVDQAPMTSMINIDIASKRSRSFRRITHAIENLANFIKMESHE